MIRAGVRVVIVIVLLLVMPAFVAGLTTTPVRNAGFFLQQGPTNQKEVHPKTATNIANGSLASGVPTAAVPVAAAHGSVAVTTQKVAVAADNRDVNEDEKPSLSERTRRAHVLNKTHNVLKDRFGRFRLQEIMKEKMKDDIWARKVSYDWINESVANYSHFEDPEWTSHCKCPEYQWYYAEHPSHPMCMNKGHAGYACGFYPESSQAESCGFGLGCIDGSWCAQCTKDEECGCGRCDLLTGECNRGCMDQECVTNTVFADESAQYKTSVTEEVTLFWNMKDELGAEGGAGAAGRATEAPIEGNFTTTAHASALVQVVKRAIVTAAECRPCGEKLEDTRKTMVDESKAKAEAQLINTTRPAAKKKCEYESKWRAEREASRRAHRRAMDQAQALVEAAKAKVRKEIEDKKLKVPGSDLAEKLFR